MDPYVILLPILPPGHYVPIEHGHVNVEKLYALPMNNGDGCVEQ